MEQSTKFSVSFDTGKLKRPRALISSGGASITGSREDVLTADREFRQLVVGVSADGSLIPHDDAIPPPPKRLVIAVPTKVNDDLPLLPHVSAESTLDAEAAKELLAEAIGLAPSVHQAARFIVENKKEIPITSYSVSSLSLDRRKNVDAELLNKLFAPNQKRVQGDGSKVPLLLRNRPADVILAKDDKAQLETDLKHRADDLDVTDLEVYERVPIEEFGAAVLRGMGVDDDTIQKALDPAGEVTKKREFTREKLGVGASSNPLLALQSQDKLPPSKRKAADPRALLQEPDDERDKRKTSKAAMIAALKEKKFPGVSVDALIRIQSGVYENQVGIITQTDGVPGLEKCRVRTFTTEVWKRLTTKEMSSDTLSLQDTEEISVGKAHCRPIVETISPIEAALQALHRQFIAEKLKSSETPAIPSAKAADVEASGVSVTGSAAEAASTTHHAGEPAIADEVHPSKRVSSDGARISQQNTRGAPLPSSNANDKKAVTSVAPRERISWLLPGIVVRIVDEKYGKYFRMKAVVQDVVAPHVCTIRVMLDDTHTKFIDNVRDSSLSTALPRPGGPAIVVQGAHRGAEGALLDRDASRQLATVQLADGDIVTVRYDDVAESARHG